MTDLFDKYFDAGRIETIDAMRHVTVQMPNDRFEIQTCAAIEDPNDKELLALQSGWTVRFQSEESPTVDEVRIVVDARWRELRGAVDDVDLNLYHVFIRVVGPTGKVLGGFHSQGHHKITKAYFFKQV